MAASQCDIQVPARADIVVIGAGFGGLYAHYRFRQLGLSVFGFEAADDVGGTWYWNRYPGARCDVESVEYCYSFSPELLEEWQWTERFATQDEILRYANFVADRFDLRRDIAFSRKVVSATYDSNSNLWTVKTDRGESIACQYLVTTVGCLSVPKEPEFEGLDQFQGQWVQTGRWPHEGIDWKDKRVAVIGTGSSGIQTIPMVAQDAAQLTVFQRTPSFSVPAYNGPIKPERLAEVKKDYPAYMQMLRRTRGGQSAPLNTNRSALEFSPEERQKKYEEAWADGRWHIQSIFKDTTTNAEANRYASEFVHEKIREQVNDPAVADKLIPRSYPLGTKRLCIDTDYYITFNRSNVELIDVNQTPIERITATGIQTRDRHFDLDLIIFATGFDAMTGPLLSLGLRGEEGITLTESWQNGPKSYLGLMCPGFPNLFTVNGPSSPSVLTNMILSIEHHIEMIADCLQYMDANGFNKISADPEVTDNWAEHTQLVANHTLFPQAKSWYMGSNVPGKPQLLMAYIGGFDTYIDHCQSIVDKGYEGFQIINTKENTQLKQAKL